MDLDCDLSFMEICRCCMRKESGMISIFDGSIHPTDCTFPPVKEMIRCIASINMQENDGFPSLICALCLNKVQAAFTFILQLIQIDEELTQMIASRKQVDTLQQSTYDTNEYITSTESTGSVKKEYESTPVFTDHSYANIDIVVKTEDVPAPELEVANKNKLHSKQEKCKQVPKLTCEVCNQTFQTAGSLEIHESEKYCIKSEPSSTDITITSEIIQFNNQKRHISTHIKDKPFMCSRCTGRFSRKQTLQNHWRKCNGNIRGNGRYKNKEKASKEVIPLTLQDLKDTLKMKNHYTVSQTAVQNNDGHDRDVNVQKAEDKADDVIDFDEICRKSLAKRRNDEKTTSYECKLCAYTNARKSIFKRHLRTHYNVKPFACPKCNRTFTQKNSMQRHMRICTGEIRASKHVISLTLEDLEDPEKIKKYYSVQSNADIGDDLVLKEKQSRLKLRTKRLQWNATFPMFNCKLCGYAAVYWHNFKRHLHTHIKNNRPFACSMCNGTFKSGSYMIVHRRKCNGEIPKNGRNVKVN